MRVAVAPSDRLCWGVLAAAMAVAGALILHLNRDTVFYVDELFFFTRSPDTGLREVLTPVNGHLIAVQRAYTKLLLELFGATYVPFRVLHVAVVVLAAPLFYAVAKHRIGSRAALAPTLVLLFLGSAWQHVVVPIGTPVILAVALGLAALLAVERGDRLGDAAACALITLSLATFSVALAFLVGIAVAVLLTPERWRRSWVFLVPLGLYLIWRVWALDLESGEQASAANVLLIPAWLFDSIAMVGAAVTGLGFDFSSPARPELDVGWGRVVATAALAGLGWRLSRGRISPALWASMAIALSYWAMAALGTGILGRVPVLVKYVYPGAVVALLVATAAASGVRLSRAALVALFAVAAIGVATNLVLLRDAGAYFRDAYSAGVRARLTALEITRGLAPPGFNPFAEVPNQALDAAGTTAEVYLAAADRYGSLAFAPSELGRQPEGLRQVVDSAVAEALDLRLEVTAQERSARGCDTARARPGEPIEVRLPAGGARLETRGDSPAAVALRRFADVPSVEVGELASREGAALSVPRDGAPRPWVAVVTGARSLEICPLE